MGIARSGIGWLIAKFLALGSSWIVSMYFARALATPTVTLGQFYVFETVVSFLMLASSAGVTGAIGKRVSERDQPKAYAVTGAVLSGIILVAVTILVALASPLFVDYFGYGGTGVLFIIGMLWALQIKNTASAILEGYSLVGRSGGIGLFDTASRAILQVVFISLGFGLFGLMSGALAGAGLSSLAAVIVLLIGVPLPSRGRLRDLVKKDKIISIVSYAKYIFLSGFATKFYDNIDIIVITAFIGSSATGIYGIGFRFSLLLSIIAGAITTSTLPEVSFHSTERDTERIKKILADSIVFVTLLSIPATVGMFVIAEPLIVTIYTPRFRDAALIATIAVGIQIPDGLRSVFRSTMNGVDRPDVTFRAGIILIFVNGILDLLLVPTVGIVGAVVASFVGISMAAFYQVYHLFKELDLSWTALPIQPVLAELGAALFMGLVVWWLKNAIALPVIQLLVLLILSGIITYFFVLLTISSGMRDRLVGIVSDFTG